MRFIQGIVLVSIVAMSGCATRGYVDERVNILQARQLQQQQRIEELTGTSRDALERATDAGVLAQGKFLYSVVLTDDSITFDSGDETLPDTGQRRLTQLADQLKADNNNVYLEIQGHTDATGPEELNYELGLERAEAVRRFLHSQGIALDRMATISYGEEMPVADNGTADGRRANRRVGIVVLD